MLSDCAAEGSTNIGRRHWASHALICCNAAECAQQLEGMVQQREADVLQGAMCIVSVFNPVLVTGCMVVSMQRQGIFMAVLCWLWSGRPTCLQRSDLLIAASYPA